MRCIILAAIVGNTLEFFDFFLFAHFGFILTPLFFLNPDPVITSIVSLGLLSVAFIMRPVGGLLFGTIGDYFGRKQSLFRSILWIALPTFCIGCMPTYQQIGLTSTFAVLICRMLQGLSAGGVYSNAGVFLMEHVDKNKRGLYSGFLAASVSIGSLMALGCVWCVMRTEHREWTWRIPFLISALLGILAYKLRKYISETPEYLRYISQRNTIYQKNQRLKVSSWNEILSRKQAFLTTIGIGALVSVMFWTPVAYTNFYLVKIAEWTVEEAMPALLIALISYTIFSIIMGYVGDKIGFRKLMRVAAMAIIVSAYPLFYALASEEIIVTQISFTVLAAAFSSAIHAVMIELYPVDERCRAISVGTSTGIALGATLPMVAAWLVNITGDTLSPALFVVLLGVFGLFSMQYYRPYQESKLAVPARA